jgi:hypothetical protein
LDIKFSHPNQAEIMVILTTFTTGIAPLMFAAIAFAHPGTHEPSAREEAIRHGLVRHLSRSLDHCSKEMRASGIEERALLRRKSAVASLLENSESKAGELVKARFYAIESSLIVDVRYL